MRRSWPLVCYLAIVAVAFILMGLATRPINNTINHRIDRRTERKIDEAFSRSKICREGGSKAACRALINRTVAAMTPEQKRRIARDMLNQLSRRDVQAWLRKVGGGLGDNPGGTRRPSG